MELSDGWEVAPSPPGAHEDPAGLDTLSWRPAAVPGTAAGGWGDGERDYDAEDWWFRCRFEVDAGWQTAPVTLQLGGVATLSETYLNGSRVASGESMWAAQQADLTGRLGARNELVIVCRALGPRLLGRRRPAARWRTRVVNAANLRFHRTMIFGRSPGFAPGPAPVGPWRPVRLVRRDAPAVAGLAIRPRVGDGAWSVHVRADAPAPGTRLTARLAGEAAQPLRPGPDGRVAAALNADGHAEWWPHTHGEPALHEIVIELDGVEVARRQVGLRALAWPADLDADGLALTINGVETFVRGAVWTPPDLITMAPSRAALRSVLTAVRDAGMNMLRVAGTGAYESPAFYDLCDELGILVWQDLMFANLDYPIDDPAFGPVIASEAREALAAVVGRPSLAVVCGNSEVEQQPAMMGLDPALGRGAFWSDTVPAVLAALEADCAYLPSTPTGGVLPFHPDGAATHYFGVSGYFQPLADLRRAPVRFASECLAFANVPDAVDVPVHHPRWKQGVMRDAGTGWGIGAGWDFDDVRDHYLASLYAVDPVQLRRSDHERYLELSRAVSGEVMAATIGEWRRIGSPCRGALVLWLKDMLAGAGLGVLDHTGAPKVAYHHLRRAMAPLAVWMTDEGVTGVAVHVANDGAGRQEIRLRVALYRDGATLVGEATETLVVPEHGGAERNVEAMLGRFVDAAWAYRFGPPTADAIIATLEPAHAGAPQPPGTVVVHFPGPRPLARETARQLGLAAYVSDLGSGEALLTISADRLVYGARVLVSGFTVADDCVTVEPGHLRRIRLCAATPDAVLTGGRLRALNLSDQIEIEVRPA